MICCYIWISKFSGDSQGDSDSDDDGGMPQCQQS